MYVHCICTRFERCFNMPPSITIVSALMLSVRRMNASLKCTSEYVPWDFDFFKLIYILLALGQWIYYVSIVFSTYTLSVLSTHLSLMFIFYAHVQSIALKAWTAWSGGFSIYCLRYTPYSTASSEIFLSFELVLNFLISSFLSQTPIHTWPLVPDDCGLAALDTLQKSLFSI